MEKLLYINASPRGEESYSKRTADAFLEAYEEQTPKIRVSRIDLFDYELPRFDSLAAEGKYALMQGFEASQEAKEAWKKVEAEIERFKGASIYLFAVPMWNFSIPYVLKQYIDIIVQPGYTFELGDDGYVGLLKGKKSFSAFARGGAYPPESPAASFDYQKPYFESILAFMGIEKIESSVIEPCLAQGREAAQESLSKAKREATSLAASFI